MQIKKALILLTILSFLSFLSSCTSSKNSEIDMYRNTIIRDTVYTVIPDVIEGGGVYTTLYTSDGKDSLYKISNIRGADTTLNIVVNKFDKTIYYKVKPDTQYIRIRDTVNRITNIYNYNNDKHIVKIIFFFLIACYIVYKFLKT